MVMVVVVVIVVMVVVIVMVVVVVVIIVVIIVVVVDHVVGVVLLMVEEAAEGPHAARDHTQDDDSAHLEISSEARPGRGRAPTVRPSLAVLSYPRPGPSQHGAAVWQARRPDGRKFRSFTQVFRPGPDRELRQS
jgi:hypothetical protein